MSAFAGANFTAVLAAISIASPVAGGDEDNVAVQVPQLVPGGEAELLYPRLRMVEPGSSVDLRPIQADIPLHNVLGLELYNHIAEAQPYKTCENETCGRLFVRQSGRSEHGQNRLRGVLCCSMECARAQARRAYRRRQRDA